MNDLNFSFETQRTFFNYPTVELLNWQPDELSEGEISAGSEEDRGSTLEPTAASLVVEGYWSRPEYVAESNSEFLCVKVSEFLKN